MNRQRPTTMPGERHSVLYRLLHFLRRENLHRILGALLLMSILSAIGLWWIEPRAPFSDWLWWSVVTLTTVGYGDIAPTSLGGRSIGILLMFMGIGVLSMLTATIASFFVERNLRKERGMGDCDLKNHIIICEWNASANEIVRELRCDRRWAGAPIVLLANLESKPIDDERLVFIRGAVTEENLERANLVQAVTVIILGDDRLEPNARDAKVVLSTLFDETATTEAYTIVELAKEENIKHCNRARADEIIVGEEISSRLIASAAVDHGVSKVISELLSSRYGTHLICVPVPSELAGRTFFDVFAEMKRANNSIVLAVQRGMEVMTNPQADLAITAEDRLIVIGEG